MPIDYAARVKRGAEFLDDLRPGWEREIRLEYLSLRICSRCVLGLVYGSFEAGLRILGLTREESEDFGFIAEAERRDITEALLVAYAELDYLWAVEIRARLKPAPPVELPAGVLELQPA